MVHDQEVFYLRCRALRWLDDDPQPGIVEVTFTDADGAAQIMIDKCIIFDADQRLTRSAAYPVDLELPVEVVGRRATQAGELLELAMPWGLGDKLPRHPVWVARDQVTAR